MKRHRFELVDNVGVIIDEVELWVATADEAKKLAWLLTRYAKEQLAGNVRELEEEG